MFRRIKMANIATTKMSSKGQVVIPEVIRKRLDLKAGSQFIVVGEKDVAIFKSISQPYRLGEKEKTGWLVEGAGGHCLEDREMEGYGPGPGKRLHTLPLES
jgi:AbrB family looped-hinge helix DNA binding protein